MAKNRNRKRIPCTGEPVSAVGPAGPGVGDVIGGGAEGVGLPDSLRRRAASDAPDLPSMGPEHRLDPEPEADEQSTDKSGS